MSQLSGLDRIRARSVVTTDPSVWWEDALDGLAPSLGLRVLDAHRRITEPGFFDRLGLGVVAFVSKLQPKLPRFKRLARRIRVESERLRVARRRCVCSPSQCGAIAGRCAATN